MLLNSKSAFLSALNNFNSFLLTKQKIAKSTKIYWFRFSKNQKAPFYISTLHTKLKYLSNQYVSETQKSDGRSPKKLKTRQNANSGKPNYQ